MLVRLLCRLRHPAPPLPADIPAIQQFAAHATHWALYVLLIVQAIVGWIATSAYRAPILVFWLFELPPIWPVDQPFSERMFGLHRLLGIAIVALLCAHIGAALYHHFVRRDRVLMRMVSRLSACGRIGDLTFQEIAAAARAQARSLCLPMGSIEQHGPHLPLNTDTVLAEALTGRIVERLGERLRPVAAAGAADRPVARARLGAGHAVAVGLRHDARCCAISAARSRARCRRAIS